MSSEGNSGIAELMGTGAPNQVRVPIVTSPVEFGVGVDGAEEGVTDADVEGDAGALVADGVPGVFGESVVPHAARRRTMAQPAAMPE
jgi:hypothetical protein